VKLAPRKLDWDLKRDVAKKLRNWRNLNEEHSEPLLNSFVCWLLMN